MSEYVEYKHRGKCNDCNDPLWVKDDIESVICSCGLASIIKGIKNNCNTLSDIEMTTYSENESGENIIIIKI